MDTAAIRCPASSLFADLAEAFMSVDWIVPAYIQLGVLRRLAAQILRAAPTDKHAVLARELPLLYQPEDLAAMLLERYAKIKHVDAFKVQIAEALEAAQLGLFHAAIATLVSVVEGTIRELADARGQPIGNGTNKLVNEIDAEIALASQLPAWCIGTPEEPTMKQAIAERVVMLTVFRDFVKNTLLAQTSRYTGAGELNRHGIVHGLFKGYGCEANFYKLVSFLDLLCFFIAIRTGSSGLAPDATAASVCLAGYYRSLSIVRAAAVAAGARPGSD
jgi:hypothetical protein